MLDTRTGNGLAGPFSSHAARTFQVAGRGGVPGNATAVTGNLTVTGQTSNGYLFLGPVATNDPTSSTLNFPLGDDRANGVTVALGAGGTLSVTFVAPNPGPAAHVIFDVTGYFVPDISGATYVAAHARPCARHPFRQRPRAVPSARMRPGRSRSPAGAECQATPRP